ncbi:MAG: DUF2935 domain-containing protein [Eubacterium sp.]|nr:DUF2935 domain-containing protein [Eubacterium sp.]
MRNNYVQLSLENHLFFGRIMKEHSLFLMAGFPSKNSKYIKQAKWFMQQFEELLRDVVNMADGIIGKCVLDSQEIVTDFTIGAERQTSFLTGVDIDSRITEVEKTLRYENRNGCDREFMQPVRMLNRRALRLVSGLIDYKEKILREVLECRLFTFNYPLLIEHILREAKMYRSIISELENRGYVSNQNGYITENFWNQIMMEHAMFIRGLLDPSEKELICTADDFAMDYCELLEEARKRECQVFENVTGQSRKLTEKYQEFKTAGTKGILECKIEGLILPLLADHVLREANHYLRLLDEECM